MNKKIETFVLKKETSENNPNVNELLGLDNELFNHCWLQLQEWPDVVFAMEPYDRDLSAEEVETIIKLLKELEPKIIDRLFLVNYEGFTIMDYIFMGSYDSFIEPDNEN